MYGNGLTRVILNLFEPIVSKGFQVDLVVLKITDYHQGFEEFLLSEVRSISLEINSNNSVCLFIKLQIESCRFDFQQPS